MNAVLEGTAVKTQTHCQSCTSKATHTVESLRSGLGFRVCAAHAESLRKQFPLIFSGPHASWEIREEDK